MKYLFGIFITLLFLGTGSVALGADAVYTPMAGVPGLAQAGSYTAEMYVDALYKLAITVGGILAVIQIIFGGVMYMFDGSITNKEEGKDKIKGALLGLLIILGAVLLLQTINPDLLKLKIFNDAPSIDQIDVARNVSDPVTPVAAGDRVSASNAAEVKRLRDTCGGPIGTVRGRAGVTELICHQSASDVKGTPGSTFDPSLFLPADRTAALNQYNQTCTSSGGVTNVTAFGTNQCNPRPLTNEEIGDVQIGNGI